ncbi:hypothetical protein [Microbacterium sp. NPDC090014]|uniref:hypothetical protein n=1 Tax=Microbacterium sp. NPDC090014 TaxID=3364205 RepID=UPI0038300BBE
MITCAACAGQSPRFACRTCGSEEFLTGTNCGRCRLQARLDELIGTVAEAPVELTRLREHLAKAPMDPRSIVRWLRRPHVTETLRGMATGALPLDHSALDLLPQRPSTRYFRRLLIEAGVLPQIHVFQHELTLHVAALAATLERPTGNKLRRFYRGAILPKLHRRYRDHGRDLSLEAFRGQRSHLAAVVRFLTWMDARELTVGDLDQRTLDRYIARVKTREPVEHFVRWATRSRLAGDLSTNVRAARNTMSNMTEEELWSGIDRLLDDEDVELEVRVAGLFVLLYAQILGRAVSMTRDQIDATAERVTVQFGITPVVLDDVVGNLVRRQLSAPSRRGYAAGDSGWLFEGLSPGRHMTAAYIRLRLTEIGIRTRISRETRMNLPAMRMPAAVVADVIGIGNHTADRRKSKAGGTWSTYPGLRR